LNYGEQVATEVVLVLVIDVITIRVQAADITIHDLHQLHQTADIEFVQAAYTDV
jgi:hypothetical protein